jgi:PAS domain S-box-containing protein
MPAQPDVPAILLSCPDPIFGSTLDGVINFWNQAADRFFGYTAEEAIGKHRSLLIPAGQEAELTTQLERVRREETVEAHETVRQHRDGRLLHVSLTSFPIRDENGEVIGSATTTRDISQALQDEEAQAASERRFRTAFDDAPVGMAIIGLDGKFLQVNRAGSELLGYSQAELQQMSDRDVVHPEDLGQDDEAFESMIRGERRTFGWEARVVRRDGGVRWMRVQTSLIRDDQGEPAYFLSRTIDQTESIAMLERLRSARLQMQEVLEHVGGASLELDSSWRVTRVNGAVEELLGVRPSEMLGQPLREVCAPAFLAPMHEALQTTMETGQRTSLAEFAVDEGTRWISMRAYPAPAGISVFLRDVTEVHVLESEIRAARSRFQQLVEQLPTGVYMHADDPEQTTFYLSPYFDKLTGYEIEKEGKFRTFAEWIEEIHPDDRGRILQEGNERAGKPGQYAMEYRVRRADGSYVWVNDIYSALVDDSGRVVAWQGIMTDISERMEMNEAISRLAAIVETSDDAIYTRTLDGIITYWNPAAERLYGYTAQEALGQPVTMLFQEKIDHVDPTFEAYHRSGPQRFQAKDVRKDGFVIDVAATLFPVRDRNGTLTEVAAIARDITDQIAAEEQLREALETAEADVRVKEIFLAMMSHELRTPLQAVLGYADYLLNGDPGDMTDDQLEDIQYIRLGALRMVALIDQLLDLSQMDAGRLELEQEPVDVRHVLEQVRQDVAPLANARDLDMSVIAPSDLPNVLGDAGRIRQILLNLAGNAVKFTASGGVQIRASAEGEWLRVAVQDTGIGIAPDQLEQIFEEFRQVESKLSRRHGGAGLGLAIARRLAEQMGGDITVESALGQGSTFTLRLPMVAHLESSASFQA